MKPTAFKSSDAAPKPTVVETETLKVTMTWIPSETTDIRYRINLRDEARDMKLPGAFSIRNILVASHGQAGEVTVDHGSCEIHFSIQPSTGKIDLMDRIWLIGNIIEQTTFTDKQQILVR